ncbi:MAG: class I SAM-dependent methyltransferase, partial [Pirellulaceae bacterium]|nr:class I SAM-dependent methyltransferase [Pirellulaceae bacterium]
MEQETREFFDDLRPDYGAAILRCVPRYEEMIAMLLAYIPPSDSVRRILELGCGEGNLTNELLQRFPDAQIDAVDFSAEMLAACERRLGTSRVTYHRQDFRQLELPL